MKPPTAKPVDRSDADKAAEALGLRVADLTRLGVYAAFRQAIRAAHPDVGATKEEAAELIATAREARHTLLQWLDSAPDEDCSACGGKGYTLNGVRAVPCGRCS
jgi:hypothetical protein